MKKMFLLINFSFILLMSYGQSVSNNNIPKIMPPSPEVAAFGKYVDIPVGHASGTPIINLPIYSLKYNQIEVPISLSYNASGIKVEETSTWVGLGWSLNTGGSLSRIIRGLPDEESTNGYMNAIPARTIAHIQGLAPGSAEYDDLRMNLIPNGLIDIEPDIFIFNAGGFSGKFYWSQSSNSFLITPFQNVKIDFNRYSDKINGFKITTPDGIQYYFGLSVDGITTSYELSDSKKFTHYSNGLTSIPPYVNSRVDMNSWSLLDIVSPTGNKISFQYNLIEGKSFGRAGETKEFGGVNNCALPQSKNATFYEQRIYKPILSRIYNEYETVEFILDTSIREDVFINEKALKQIKILNSTNNFISSYKFEYHYTISDDSVSLPGLEAYANVARKRLILEKFYKVDITDEIISPHIFNYSDIKLPSRLSSSQDHWGYYNNRPSYGNFLTPRVTPDYAFVLNSLNFGSTNYLLDADRRIDVKYTQAGILTKITYPTGGSTRYTYESNLVPLIHDDIIQKFERSGLKEDSVVLPEFIDINQNNVINYIKDFTIGNIYAKAKIIIRLPWCNSTSNGVCNFTLKIESLTNQQFYLPPFETSIEAYISLPPGNYRMTAQMIQPNNGDPLPQLTNQNIILSWKEQADPYNFIFGGIRTKKIVSYDGLGNTVSRSFKYNLFINDSVSSAFIEGFPSYVDLLNTCMAQGTTGAVFGQFGKIFSNSVSPLCGDGKLVRYTNVTEYIDSNKSSSKINYTFSNNLDDYSYSFQNGSIKKDWQNNLLVKKQTYEKTIASNYLIKEEIQYNYSSFDNFQDDYMGATYKPLKIMEDNFASGTVSYSYIFRSEWYLPISSTTKNYSYDANGNQKVLSSTTTNTYNSKHLITKTTTTNSQGKIIENNIWYPDDYNNIGYNLDLLKTKNIIQNPIKQETWVNNKIKSGNLILYNSNGQPTSVYNYENNLLINPPTHNPNLLLNNNYNLKQNINYFADGNVKELLKTNDIPECYFWGYNNQYPVAKVISKPYDVVLSLSGIDINILNNPNTTDIAMRAELAKLRNVSDCLVTSYTYKPLIGVTSETDTQGKTIYYEYDSFNRLKLIRDKDNNILKTFDYKYQQQQN